MHHNFGRNLELRNHHLSVHQHLMLTLLRRQLQLIRLKLGQHCRKQLKLAKASFAHPTEQKKQVRGLYFAGNSKYIHYRRSMSRTFAL